MSKSPAERKAAQRARQFAAGNRKIELVMNKKEIWRRMCRLDFRDLST